MASGTSDLIVRLSLDTTQFEGSLSKFEGQMTKLQSSCTNATTGITNFKQVTAQLQTSAQTLTDKLAAQKQKVADLEAAYEKSKFNKKDALDKVHWVVRGNDTLVQI